MAEERVKPRSMFVEEAIQAALESRWDDALEINQTLVERHGTDEDTQNRVGKALTELGRLDEALEAYSSSLQLNPLNLIAQKNVRKLSALREQKDALPSTTQAIDVDLFTEEPGKSGLTVLRAAGRGATVAVAPGDVIELHRSGSQLLAETSRGVSLGDVEPKLARRLVPLIQSGNRYAAAVARVGDQGNIEIIIREVFQSPENARKSSFPTTRTQRRDDFRPYAKDTLLGAREVDE
ncbi:MAG: tetratricopeptide repeat protein, partial [Candidatus Dormibacteraeota bacterium]|nr:tetratricopeptide repeat protein [Candidatus Dormibacteraeota bacterium]